MQRGRGARPNLQVLLAWLVLIEMVAVTVAEENVFVPTNEQKVLLQEGIEQAKELKERYINLTMAGATEYFDSAKPHEHQHFTGDFRYVRLGSEYCLVEIQVPNPDTRRGKPEMIHVCRLINPSASYQFLAQGQNDPPVFVLGEKIPIKDEAHRLREIEALVLSNWQTGSTPYRVSIDLTLPFDISTAQKNLPMQGGYIKGIDEEMIGGERVVILKMGYYFRDQESSGKVSFYPDYYWAVKDSMAEGINSNTGKVSLIFKTSNVYDFSDTFPKLTKTTIETWNADANKLLESTISTITSIDFTTPDVATFDPKQYVGGAPIDDEKFVLPKQRLSPWQIIGIIIGIILIIWGLWMRFAGKKEV